MIFWFDISGEVWLQLTKEFHQYSMERFNRSDEIIDVIRLFDYLHKRYDKDKLCGCKLLKF